MSNQSSLQAGQSGTKLNLHNPLKGPIRQGSNTATNSRRPSFIGEELDENSTLAKNGIVGISQKQLEGLEEEKAKLEKRVAVLETQVTRKDAEFSEVKLSLQEKADLIINLQEENKKLQTNVKVLKEKRDLGLKEIQKLRDKIETMKINYSLNDSLNTSFNLSSMNDSVNLSQHEKGQIADLLQG